MSEPTEPVTPQQQAIVAYAMADRDFMDFLDYLDDMTPESVGLLRQMVADRYSIEQGVKERQLNKIIRELLDRRAHG